MEIVCILTILLLQWNLPFPFLCIIGTNFSKSQSHGFRLVCPELHGQKVKGKVKVTVNLHIHYISVVCPSCSLISMQFILFSLLTSPRNFIEGMVEVRGILFIVVLPEVQCLPHVSRLTPSPMMFQWLKQSSGKHQLS